MLEFVYDSVPLSVLAYRHSRVIATTHYSNAIVRLKIMHDEGHSLRTLHRFRSAFAFTHGRTGTALDQRVGNSSVIKYRAIYSDAAVISAVASFRSPRPISADDESQNIDTVYF
jgi:hypothetical protein